MTVIFSSLYFIDSSLLRSRFLDVTQRSPQRKRECQFSLKLCPQDCPSPWPKSTGAKVFRLHDSSWSKLIKQASSTTSRFIRDCKNENSLSDRMWILLTSKVLSFRRETNERGKHARERTRDTRDTRGEVNALAGTILSRRNKGLPAV